LVTAGPTHEYIDTVRFIGNASSGKMGCAIAEALAQRGADVHLVLGPAQITTTHSSIRIQRVRSAQEMADACFSIFPNVDIAVLTAAVADFTPKEISTHKLKRGKEDWHLRLAPTQDIAAELGRRRQNKQFLVGFALEDTNEMDNAVRKLHSKNLDMIVLNSLNDKGAGFDVATNKISIIERSGDVTHFPLKSKEETADDVVNKIAESIDTNLPQKN
jgi:phosphopantothenoylcysteine decarboxylase/phosphopantothenate--cysteine ligase